MNEDINKSEEGNTHSEKTKSEKTDTVDKNSENMETRSDMVIRGLYMILFCIANRVVYWIISLFALFQFVYKLIVREINPQVVEFTKGLNAYLFQTAEYLTYHTEEKPWPFSQWPKN